MKKTTLFLFSLFPFFLFGQKNERTTALQFSLQTFASGIEMYPYNDGRGAYTFAGPSVGLAKFDTKNRYSLIELSAFSFRDKFVDFELKNTLLGLRYERGTYIFHNSEKSALKFRLGASAELSYSNQDREPNRATVFPRNQRTLGVTLAATPHAEYWPGENMYFDLGPSLAIWNFGYERSLTENPALTERQQHRGGFYLDGLGFMVRIGFGVKF